MRFEGARRAVPRVALAGAAAVLAACGGKEKSAAPAIPAQVVAIGGLRAPESVKYDSGADVFYISNINGDPGAKDDNGYIARLGAARASGAVRADSLPPDSLLFIAGGRNGVTLHAPKGLALTGDTLWVADIDAVRGFDKRTGAPLATVDLGPMGAVFLNDIAVGPDGALYVTDTGIRIGASGVEHPGPDRIFRIAGGRATVAIQSDSLDRPNGIAWDASNRRFIVAPYGESRTILAWRPGMKQPVIIARGPAACDGVEVLPDGRLVITSWADSAVSIRDGDRETRLRQLPSPADLGVDTRRGRLAIPLLTLDRVELWTIPPRAAQP